MNSRSDAIKAAVTMEQVALMYGYKPTPAGFIKCPFHADKTASVKVYPGDRGWHCFGCHSGGDVIHFVQQLLGMPFQEALDRLNTDFRLGIGKTSLPSAELARRRREAEQKAARLDAYRKNYDKKCLHFRRLWLAKKAGYEHPDYAEACRDLDALEYWFDTHPWR